MPPLTSFAEHALRIWNAGVAAVAPRQCVANSVAIDGHWLIAGDAVELDLRSFDRVLVVGGGKAAGGIASALETLLAGRFSAPGALTGLVAVPDDAPLPAGRVQVCPGRPAGQNEPHPRAAAATSEMLRLVAEMGPRDLALAVVTGGASALLVAPPLGVSLADKLAVTRHLAAAGADIVDLNRVRRQISQVKGGGLARVCTTGAMLGLVMSDVPGDDLTVIGSGPCAANDDTPCVALEILAKYGIQQEPTLALVVDWLRSQHPIAATGMRVPHVVLAASAVAVDGAGILAEQLGYNHAMQCATHDEGPAEELGRHLARLAAAMRDEQGPNCLISGGETTVTLPSTFLCGRGGRNQQLALAALLAVDDWRGIALVSAGTDGEDGPTDAAGAIVDELVVSRARAQGLDAADHLRRCDAYTFFDRAGGLLRTGPTGTNVSDLRVLTVAQRS